MPNTSSTWDPESIITLCKVPYDSNYANVVDWQSHNDIDIYMNSLSSTSITLSKSTYMPVGQPIVIDVPYSIAYKYNYCYVVNPNQTEAEDEQSLKTYYYFIVSCDYNNPSTVTLTLQLDVWTTYKVDMSLGYAFLESGHLAMANAPSLADTNIPRNLMRYMDIAEGIDMGNDMYTFHEVIYSLQVDGNNVLHSDTIIIMSTADMSTSFGTVDSPQLNTAQGGVSGGLFNGCDIYMTDKEGFPQFVNYIKEYSWVSQCIVSITCVPYKIIDLYSSTDSNLNGSQPSFTFKKLGSASAPPIKIGEVDINNVIDYGWPDVRVKDIRKLWSYPYTVIEVSGWNGNSLFLRPQCLGFNVNDLLVASCIILPFARIGVFPAYYNRSPQSSATYTVSYSNASANGVRTVYAGDFIDTALWISDFPQFSIVNNSYLTYLASTAGTRQYQYNTAEWSMASANMQAGVGYGNTLQSLAVQQANAEAQLRTEQANYRIGQTMDIVNAASNTVGNLFSGDIVGTLQSAATGIVNLFGEQAQFQNSQNLAYSQLANTQALGYSVSDRNNQLAEFVNQGNYKNAIQSVEAGIKDASVRQPSTVGLMGGEGFLYSFGLLFSVTVKYKRISDDAVIRCAQYFRRYGYRINRVVQLPRRLNVCEYYSYYKCVDPTITLADSSEVEKDAIRGILSNGVTVWESPGLIGYVNPLNNTVVNDRIGNYY